MQRLLHFFTRFGELIFLICLLVFSLFFFGASFFIQSLSSASDAAGPGFMPKLIFGALVALSALLLLAHLPRQRRLNAKAPHADLVAAQRGAVSILGIVGFVLLMDKLGFLLSSGLYLFFEMYCLGPREKRRPLLLAALAAVFCLAVYYLFRYRVYIQLPKGILG